MLCSAKILWYAVYSIALGLRRHSGHTIPSYHIETHYPKIGLAVIAILTAVIMCFNMVSGFVLRPL
mgnify:CR=1 FL=1